MSVPEFRQRAEALFGKNDISIKLMTAFGRGHSSIDEWLSGKNIHSDVMDVIELLEVTPRQLWPDKWAQISGVCAPESTKERIMELERRRVAHAEIARIVGVSRQRVDQICSSVKIGSGGRAFSYKITSPDSNMVHEVYNLSLWCRENENLFSPSSAKQIRTGFGVALTSSTSKYSKYKGWSIERLMHSAKNGGDDVES